MANKHEFDEFDGPIGGRFVSRDRAYKVADQEIQNNPLMNDYWMKACEYVVSKNGAEFDDFDREFRQWEVSYFVGYPLAIQITTNSVMPIDLRIIAWLWLTEYNERQKAKDLPQEDLPQKGLSEESLSDESLRKVQGTYIECRYCGEKTQYVAELNENVEYSRAYCTSCKDPGPYSVLYNKCSRKNREITNVIIYSDITFCTSCPNNSCHCADDGYVCFCGKPAKFRGVNSDGQAVILCEGHHTPTQNG
jgi:hypothetical protein